MGVIHAKEECLRTWNANSDVSRLDYFSPHKLADLHDEYFKSMMWRFSVGDILYVKDPDGRRAELEVLSIDEETNRIQFGLIRELTVKPISASGYAIEKRRIGTGDEFFVIGPDGKTVADDLSGEKGARKALERLEETVADEAGKPKRKAKAAA